MADFDEEFRTEIISGLEETYQTFLKDESLTDNSINRIAFYKAGVAAVKADPADDPDFQECMLNLLDSLILQYAIKVALALKNLNI